MVLIRDKLLPSARHERRVGAFLVRAARERRPEGPSYLLPTIFLAGVLLQHTFPPIGIWGFPQDPSEGSSLCFLIFGENSSQQILLT